VLRRAVNQDLACISGLRADTALQHLLLANPGTRPADDLLEDAAAWVLKREAAGFFRIVVDADDEAVGFTQIFDIHGKNRFGWLSIALLPQARRRGLGAAALAATEQAAQSELDLRKILLQVRIDNAAAIRLYERAHWRRSGHLQKHYDDGGALYDVFIYEKLLLSK
jgi:RimJ/RimL family protein N-acetyltransferase